MRKIIIMIILVGVFGSFSIKTINAAHKAAIVGIDIPYNAEIAGIRAGYDTVGQLEHRLWPGTSFYRNRPDRASVWQVKSTGWIIEANDGEYKDRKHPLYGYSIKTLDYAYAASAKGRVCYVALPPGFLSFNKRIRLGMPKRKVISILYAMHIPTRGVNDVEWSKDGSWAASFHFRKDILVAIGLYCS